MMKNYFFKGARLSIPIMLGYTPIAISFGAAAKAMGINYSYATLMSGMVFAGASQFLAIAMLSSGISAAQIIFATLVVNLRHLVFSFSLLKKTNKIGILNRLLLFMGLTDETFALISLSKSNVLKSTSGIAGLIVCSYLSWVIGTFIGGYLVSFFSEKLLKSMTMALYSLFISLLITALFGNLKYIFVIIASITLNLLLSRVITSSWALLIAIVVSPLILTLFKQNKSAKETPIRGLE